MTTDPIGLYVHIPYCIRKCSYCDFCSLPLGQMCVPDAYIDSLIREIYNYGRFGKIKVSTVYFGGGTPSLLSSCQLEKVISALKNVFDFEDNVEFTVEANPGTLDSVKLSLMLELGINRLSLGVQSFNDNELLALGRIHTAADAIRSFETARRIGFDNVSIDLMYGIPYQTDNSLLNTLKSLSALRPDHVSVYGLIIEEGTPFYDNLRKLSLPSEDAECDMYYMAAEFLQKLGYSHYEISNYALRGKESQHNLKYWRDEEYIGFGASAASYFMKRRYKNTVNIEEYITSSHSRPFDLLPISTEDEMFEYAMMRLRLSEGFSLSDYKAKFGVDFKDGKEEIIRKFESHSLVVTSGDRISLTEKGFYLSNSILSELL